MPAVQETSNKATLMRFLEAMNSHDPELLGRTIDELFEPDVKQHSPFEARRATRS